VHIIRTGGKINKTRGERRRRGTKQTVDSIEMSGTQSLKSRKINFLSTNTLEIRTKHSTKYILIPYKWHI